MTLFWETECTTVSVEDEWELTARNAGERGRGERGRRPLFCKTLRPTLSTAGRELGEKARSSEGGFVGEPDPSDECVEVLLK